jgi:hypothetical protein
VGDAGFGDGAATLSEPDAGHGKRVSMSVHRWRWLAALVAGLMVGVDLGRGVG